MRTLKGFTVLSGLGLLLLVAAAPLVADEAWRTTLTISEPTEIPGTVLEPGKYIVQVLNTKEPRMVVQFLSGDGSKNVATVLGVPNYRVKLQEGGQFTYFQRSEGAPQALKDWFYVGNNFGIEFVYPRETAVKIARASRQEVYAAPSAKPEVTEEVVAVTPELKEQPLPPAPAPRPPEAVVAKRAPAPEPRPATLPKTASNLGFLALAGLAAMGGAATLRIATRRA
jgi:hypothetical protein